MQLTESWSECIEGRQTLHALNYSVSYISSRQLLVVGKEFVGDLGRNLFSLQPEPHSASLQNLIGQL